MTTPYDEAVAFLDENGVNDFLKSEHAYQFWLVRAGESVQSRGKPNSMPYEVRLNDLSKSKTINFSNRYWRHYGFHLGASAPVVFESDKESRMKETTS